MPASLTEVNKSSLVQPVLWLKYDLSLQNLALQTKMRQSPQMLEGPFKILPPAPPCTSGMCLYQRTAVSGCCCVWPLNRSMPLVTTAKLPSLFLPSCDQAYVQTFRTLCLCVSTNPTLLSHVCRLTQALMLLPVRASAKMTADTLEHSAVEDTPVLLDPMIHRSKG